ncbi:ribonuclease H-like domain-containing protein [Lobosporangium transversale]|uniref:Ribonuclease H-like domain-containing protein n=1 Tax=Lobosporangium transversale TaxID=64571 RepID=A0A1Y2GJY7_9FUNG|nr:ribonuclease H-like domain-containing protein [Lobosporangium transversale]ORZ13319.1 ribonuclease H-like domain-containing protein [Lobosporangium transversale]|eukprot:XP_021880400.1 ribonuclease H-like domain-containing protein [Lobosporangium transversale]
MEILKSEFEASLPILQKAISECDFIALDTEFTGLASPTNIPKIQDSLNTRYSKVAISAAAFLVVQLGICTFTWSDEIGGYEARPFNFPCFPSSDDEAKAGERFFKVQSTSLEFLIKNGFDFNKWIRDGIPYMTRTEEEAYIIRKTEKESAIAATNMAQSNILIDDRNRDFMLNTASQIQNWLQNSTEKTLTIAAPNSYFRRLVHQIIRTDFNDGLYAESDALARTMIIQRMTDELRQQKEQAKIAKPPTLNLRRVLDMISDAGKPVIGHNCFLDLMQVTQQFFWDLPYELEDWKRALNLEWSTIIDTKHLAGHPLISPFLASTGLEPVSECVQKAPFAEVGPKIVMARHFNRYLADASVALENKATKEKNDTKYHEAGYDAYITGQAFLRFAGYILKAKERTELEEEEEHARKKRKLVNSDEEEEEGEIEETTTEKDACLEKQKRILMGNPTIQILENEELKSFYNILHIMRSEVPTLYLAGPDPEPQEKPHHFLLKNIPSTFQTSTLFHLFAPYNPQRFVWLDSNNAWIHLSLYAPAREGEESNREPYIPTPVPLGRLGEDYVNPYCVGNEDIAVRGRALGVVPEAAHIEVVSWKAWFDERETLERQQRQSAGTARDSNGRGLQRFGRVSGSSIPQDVTITSSPVIGSKRKHGANDEEGR